MVLQEEEEEEEEDSGLPFSMQSVRKVSLAFTRVQCFHVLQTTSPVFYQTSAPQLNRNSIIFNFNLASPLI